MSDGQIDDLPPLRSVIESHGLNAKKSLGQNFILDLNLTSRIARAAGSLEDCHVLEIGPGPGGLTRAIMAQNPAHLTVVEMDSRAIAAQQEIADHYPGKMTIIEGDAMKVAEQELLSSGAPKRKIIANLPYNIGTQLLLKWLNMGTYFDSMTLLFQKEVGQRITAVQGDNHYGRLAVLCQWLCETEMHFDIGPKAFVPPPKVTSALVGLRPRSEPLYPAKMALLEQMTAAAFGQRRKMLRQSLKSLGGSPADLLDAAGIEGTRRAETLSVEEFCALARALESVRS